MNATPQSLRDATKVRAARLGIPAALRDELPFLAGVLFGLGVMAVFGFFAGRDRNLPVNDFSYMWAGGHTVLDGRSPYDGTSFPAESLRFGTAPPQEAVFAYPPWVALALVPFAALPLWIASGVFTYGGMLLAALALRAIVRSFVPNLPIAHTLAGVALFASQPGIAAMEAGQWGFLVAAVSAWSVIALRLRSTRRVFVSVALLVKPQLALFAVWALLRATLARAGRRVAIALAAAFGAVIVATVLLFAAIAAGLAFDPRGDAWLGVWLATSAAFPVYSWSYDQVVLVVPLVIATGVVLRRSRGRALAVAAAGFGFLLLVPTLLYEIADRRQNESFSAFVPLAVLALVLVASWPMRRERAGPPA